MNSNKRDIGVLCLSKGDKNPNSENDNSLQDMKEICMLRYCGKDSETLPIFLWEVLE